MHKKYSTPKIVKTWVLLFCVPLYIGATSLWMKDEIKLVLTDSTKETQMGSLESQVQKSFAEKNLQHQTVLLPSQY